MNRADVFVRRRRIRTLEIWTMRAIIVEAFFLALFPSIAAAAVLFGTVTWVMRLALDNKFKMRALPFDTPAMIFALIALVSVFNSSSLNFELLYHFCSFVGIYGLTYLLIGQNIRSRQQVRAVVIALAASALLVVLWGYFQFVFGIDTADMKWVDPEKFPELRKRVFSTLENPNVLAGYLDIFICLALGVLAKVAGRTQKFAMIIAIVMLAACHAMTYARGAYLTIAIVFVIYGIIQDWRVFVFFLFVTGGILHYDAAFVDRMLSIFIATDSSEGLRIGIWTSTLAMITDHPFIGIGWGAFKSVYPNYDYYLKGANVEIFHAHNIFLHHAAEVGIIGAMAFFWYFFGTMLMTLELGANRKFNAIKDKVLSLIERIWNVGLKRKLAETAGEIKERYLIENGRLERLVRMKERTEDAIADASEKFIGWISLSKDDREDDADGESTATVEKVSLKKKISLKKTKLPITHRDKPIESERSDDNSIEDESEEKEAPRIKRIMTPTVDEDKKIFDWNEVAEISNRQITDGVKFGIGLAFLSMTLNGLTDNLLFNIPTSMLMWLLGALGGAISLLPENEEIKRRK